MEACHRLEPNHWPENVIVKLTKRKYVTDFYSRNIKGYGAKIHRIILGLKWVSSNQRKWKLPRNIGFTHQQLYKAFQHRCVVSWWQRGRIITFQEDLACFWTMKLLFMDLVYILCLFISVTKVCFSFFVGRYFFPILFYH